MNPIYRSSNTDDDDDKEQKEWIKKYVNIIAYMNYL